jgi:hypothetical protein
MAAPLDYVMDPSGRLDTDAVQRNFDSLATQGGVATGGRTVEVRFGGGTATFTASNSSATVVVPHGLGRTPSSVIVCSSAGFGIFYQSFTWTTTTFTAQGAYPFGPLSGAYTFSWIAFG